MATNEFDKILTQARKNAADINKLATKLGVNLSSYFPEQLKALNDCLDTYSASKVMVATVVADARGELSLEGVAKLASNFDKNWDKFAAEYSAIFSHSSSAAKTNVLETFARNHFGDTVFEAGSVIKNETPNILNGILGFQRGIDAFGGSYRNPEEAANKIKTGVSLIVNSTAQVANSANNVLKFIQRFKQTDPKGSAILSNIAKLPQWRPVASAMSVLGIGSAGISLAGNAKGALESLKKGDIAGAAQQGKAVLSQAKTIKDEISKLKSGAFSKNDTLSRSGTLSKGSELSGGNMPPSKANASNTNANAAQKQESPDSEDSGNSGNSGNSDSYVCSTARIRCTNGDKISQLTVLPDRTIWLTGQPQANISDHQSMVNIAPFGRCHTVAYPPTGSATAANHGTLTPMPCVPNTPFPWMGGKDDVILKGQPALLKSSKCRCAWGGIITITYDGQTDGNQKMLPIHPRQSMSQAILSKDEYTQKLGKALPDNISKKDKEKLADNMMEVAKMMGTDIKSPMTIEQADKQSANPLYEEGNDYSVNCATAAATYVLRLRGLDITAKPKNENNELNVWLSKLNSFKIWKNTDGSDAKPSTYRDWMDKNADESNPIKEMTPNLYKRFIEENTKEEGVYIINVGWQKGGGHATVIQRWRDDKGKLNLSYIEPQVYNESVGVKQDLDNLVNYMASNPHPERGIMRVDNKILDPKYVSLFEINNGNSTKSNTAS